MGAISPNRFQTIFYRKGPDFGINRRLCTRIIEGTYLKIAFIRDEFDPYGGAENFLHMLSKRLAKKGAEVHLFVRKWPAGGENGAIRHLVPAPASPSFLRHLVFTRRVLREVAMHEFDIVQSHERMPGRVVFRAGDGVHARWLQIRSENATFLKKVSVRLNPYHFLVRLFEKQMFESLELKAAVANSNMVRNEILSRFRVAPGRVRTIYNGVDSKRFSPENRANKGSALRRSMGIDDDTPVVLFVGSGFERKGVSTLVKASSLLTKPFRAWIVGKGDFRKYREMGRRLGVSEQIRFWGPRRDVETFYAAADIFVFPTLYDPFPSVVLEAMASGLPVVTTTRCGAAEIIRRGKDGFVVESPGDFVRTASYIQRLFSRDLRESMAKSAAARAKCFSVESTVEQYERLYQQMATF